MEQIIPAFQELKKSSPERIINQLQLFFMAVQRSSGEELITATQTMRTYGIEMHLDTNESFHSMMDALRVRMLELCRDPDGKIDEVLMRRYSDVYGDDICKPFKLRRRW